MKLLEINNIKKTFDDLEVLKDISISVEEGEVVSILGPSGSGKSTLLRCATFLETMDAGSMYYCGEEAVKDVDGKSVYAGKHDLKRIMNYFGLVFQNFNLFPHYTVLKNIMDAPVHVQKRDKKKVYDEAMSLLRQMGIEDRADYLPCQRVAIARALAMNPKILFFDEPTSALDPELTAEILKVLRLLAEKKMTMVIVTHEIEFARNVSDRVIFMDEGYIIEQGAPEDVIDNPANDRVRAFLAKVKG